MRKMQKRFLGVLLAGTMAVGSVTAIKPNVLVQTVEAATEQLSKPTNVHWDGLTATWNPVPNATGYEVALVGLEDEEEVAKKVVTSNSCDFFQEVAATGVGYRVRVRALDDTGKYAGSDAVYCMPVMILWLNTTGGNLEKDNDGVGMPLYLIVPMALQMNLSDGGPLLKAKKEGNILHYYHNEKELFYVNELTFDYTVLEGVTDADNLVLVIDDAKENESPGMGIGFYDASQMQPGKTPEEPAQPTPVVSDNPSVSTEPTPIVSGNPSAPVSSEPVKSSVPAESAAPATSAKPAESTAPAASTASGSNTTPVQSTAPAASATPAVNTQNETSNGTTTSSDTAKPKGTSLSSVKAGKKKMTVKWKKQANQTTGYQIQYARNSKFTSAKTKTVSKNSTTSITISKLSSKKKYYVRIRTYKTANVNGTSTKLYSGWSKAKTVKVK